jgi:uncharacterized protein YxjI
MRFRRQERHDERQGQTSTRFQVRQRALSIGDDFFIDDEHGNHAYRVNGKALRIRQTMLLEDADGNELLKIQKRLLRIKDSMEIEDPHGNRVALVKSALISPLRDRWVVKVEEGSDLHVQGNIVDHEYKVNRDGVVVAEISRRWFRLRDTYGVEVEAGADVALMLAVTVVVDAMAHPER